MVKALLPGTFDPPTNGHIDIIGRAADIFDEIIVVVADNARKKPLLGAAQRCEAIREIVADKTNVTVTVWDSLIAEFAAKNECHILIRGVRDEADFGYERDLAQFNRFLNNELETMLLPSHPGLSIIRSSYVKELWSLGGEITELVPPQVKAMMDRCRSTS